MEQPLVTQAQNSPARYIMLTNSRSFEVSSWARRKGTCVDVAY